jgi:preprotein translocase subunit SecG
MASGFIFYTFSFLLLFASLLMILLVLIQRGRGGGLAGAFGGMGGQSAFGTRAGDVFTRITVGVAIVWVLTAGVLGISMRARAEQQETGSEVFEGLEISSGEEEGDTPPVMDAGDTEAEDASATETTTPEPATGAESSPDDSAATTEDGAADAGPDTAEAAAPAETGADSDTPQQPEESNEAPEAEKASDE